MTKRLVLFFLFLIYSLTSLSAVPMRLTPDAFDGRNVQDSSLLDESDRGALSEDRGQEEKDSFLDYSEENLPQHLQKAQEAQQLWSQEEASIPRTVQEQHDFLEEAEGTMSYWEGKRNWCRHLAEGQPRGSHQENLQELSHVCGQVREAIEHHFFPFQLEEELTKKGYGYVEAHEKAVMKAYQLPFLKHEIVPSAISMEQEAALHREKIEDLPGLKKAAEVYHQGNPVLWRQYSLAQRHSYNQWVVQKNGEYATLQKQKFNDIEESLHKVGQQELRKQTFWQRWYDDWFDRSTLYKLEEGLDKKLKQFCRSQEALQIAKMSPEERTAFLQNQLTVPENLNERKKKAWLMQRQAQRAGESSDHFYDKWSQFSDEFKKIASAYERAGIAESKGEQVSLAVAKEYYNKAAEAYEQEAKCLEDISGKNNSSSLFACLTQNIGDAYQHAATYAESNIAATNAYEKRAKALEKKLEAYRQKARASDPQIQHRYEREIKLQELLASVYEKIASNFISGQRLNEFQQAAYLRSTEYYEKANQENARFAEQELQLYFKIATLSKESAEATASCNNHKAKVLYDLSTAYMDNNQEAITRLDTMLQKIEQEELEAYQRDQEQYQEAINRSRASEYTIEQGGG